ncbi:GTP binding protein [Mycena kentingensis (nom. inval.)]|nr:GTP binding protein [Mycena kentingensis (nom. inval.)]
MIRDCMIRDSMCLFEAKVYAVLRNSLTCHGSTLINTIFASHLIDSKGRFASDEPVRQTTETQGVSHVIVQNGVKLRLNIVDTPGYGDHNENCWDPIIKYIKEQHSAFDTRIHCCLFLLSPTGHSLRPIDGIVMKKLSDVVNVVPAIAKSDSLTAKEKIASGEELVYHNIRTGEDEEDEVALN